MKFDSNLAWKQASEAVSANREVLFAIAGVFVLLPNLAVALLFPQPETQPGITPKQAMEVMQVYFRTVMPWMFAAAVVQAVGTLSMLTLFTDRARPTVADALKQGLTCLVPYLLAQLLLAFALVAIAGVLIGIAAATKSAAIIALVTIAVLAGAIYAGVKTSLASPVIAVEGQRNPLAALQRSWHLTKGNSLAIFAFYLLVGVVFAVILVVGMVMVGALLAVLLGVGETARMIATVVSSLLGMIFTTYFVAIIAAVHRQLAGPSGDAVGATFE